MSLLDIVNLFYPKQPAKASRPGALLFNFRQMYLDYISFFCYCNFVYNYSLILSILYINISEHYYLI